MTFNGLKASWLHQEYKDIKTILYKALLGLQNDIILVLSWLKTTRFQPANVGYLPLLDSTGKSFCHNKMLFHSNQIYCITWPAFATINNVSCAFYRVYSALHCSKLPTSHPLWLFLSKLGILKSIHVWYKKTDRNIIFGINDFKMSPSTM